MKRVIVYVDGFNLYHAIDNLGKPHLKWVDLVALGQGLLRADEQLVAVKYFSAYATWKPAQYARHREYTAALQYAGAAVFMGKFKKKDKECRSCLARWVGHEEKESDVKLSIALVSDAYEDLFDRAIVISADSDLVPPILMVRSKFKQKEVFVAAPPGRMGIGRDLKPALEISRGRLAKALLPETALTPEGKPIFTRPVEYAPPNPPAVTQTAPAVNA